MCRLELRGRRVLLGVHCVEIADATMNTASRDPQRVITRDNGDYNTDTLLYCYYELSGGQGYNCHPPLCVS